MKKIFLFLIAVLAALSLISCSGGDEAPEGMQLIFGSDAAGYYFYAPEEWIPSNLGEVKAAYTSRVDTTSVSFAEVYPEKLNDTEKTTEEFFFSDYFDRSLSEFHTTPDVTLKAEKTTFGSEEGKADRAEKYTYSYLYSGHRFGFMQILIKEGDSYYIFTFSSLLEEKSDDQTYYDFYAEKLQSVIDNFKFVNKSGELPTVEYERDSDGYILASDKALSGFDLYVPESFNIDFSDAVVSATHSDGTNINMTRATSTGDSFESYYDMRKKELSVIVSDFSELKPLTATKLDDSDAAFLTEYTYLYNGAKYHVYQIYAVSGMNLYSLTYTATEENYEKHIEELNTVISKVAFR